MKSETIGKYEIRATRLTVSEHGDAIFAESATHVEIADEGCGEFVRVKQQASRVEDDAQSILIEADEWPALKWAIETMLTNCRDGEPEIGAAE